MIGKEGASEVDSCGEGQAPAVVVELVDGVTGNGLRTVPLSFQSTVELIQDGGHAQVVKGVAGFRFVTGNQSETLPDRTRIIF